MHPVHAILLILTMAYNGIGQAKHAADPVRQPVAAVATQPATRPVVKADSPTTQPAPVVVVPPATVPPPAVKSVPAPIAVVIPATRPATIIVAAPVSAPPPVVKPAPVAIIKPTTQPTIPPAPVVVAPPVPTPPPVVKPAPAPVAVVAPAPPPVVKSGPAPAPIAVVAPAPPPVVKPAAVVVAPPAPPQPVAVVRPLPTTRLSATLPSTTPGQVRLRFYTTIDNAPADMCVVVSTSKKIAETSGQVPVLIFLGGMGDRGSDGNGVFRNGPPAEMMRHPDINDSLPLLVISPQCPSNRQWAEPGVAQAVVQLVETVLKDPRIDPDRIYLSGFSLGGTGTWAVADAGPQLFAAISPIAPREFSVESCSETIQNIPTWIICGDKDPVFFQGSLAMLGIMRKTGADVSMTIKRGAGHDEWKDIYPKLEYYDWFLAHRRGQAPARQYSDDELVKLVNQQTLDPITIKVNKEFTTFAPYWQVSNFSVMGNPGLKEDALGHKNVFVIRPLNAQVNTIMETTWAIPTDKKGRLSVLAGWDGASDWKLVVNVAGHDVLTTAIDKSTAVDGWFQTSVDLSEFTGKKVHIDVMISPGTNGPGPVYLGKLAVDLQ